MPRRELGKFKARKKVCNANIKRLCSESDVGIVDISRPSTSSSPVVSRPRPVPSPERKESSSKKKVGPMLDQYEQFVCLDNSEDNYDIVNLPRLQNMVAKVAVCAKCSGPIVITASNRHGLSLKIRVSCSDCGHEVAEYNDSSTRTHTEKSEINTRLVYGFRCIGKGEESAKKVCAVLSLPSPPSFKYYNTVLCNAAKEVCVESMRDAVEETVLENDGDRDITAIFDGTWQRRGHRSINGAVTAISANTGKVLDVQVYSKHCRCMNRLQDIHEVTCVANYEGASGGMEVKGAIAMFQRSVPNYNIRYKYYLGDGDSAAHPSVVASAPYGPDFVIGKLECVGHVQKRMGARLATFKTKKGKQKLGDGKTIGGRGRLTGAVIKEIQLYYGLAIRRNTSSVQDMRRAVWAEFCHLRSSNEKPEHLLCPDGPDTWCKYIKARDSNEPYDHTKHTHIPSIVMEEIRPIFKDLSNRVLLTKCLHGGTQNANESLNSIIWSRIPKSTFVMKNTLEFGVYEAVACFNMGNVARCKILKKLGISPGQNFVNTMEKADLLRIKKAEKAIEEIEKKCRKQASLAKTKIEDKYEEAGNQDKPVYGAGLY